MKAYGDPIVVDFGEDPKVSGFSAMQLIETSDITAHFSNKTNRAYIDVFSCKPFYPYKTAEFCKTSFKAKDIKVSPIVFRY